jgi:predicted Zn finger-like uncharacterized protein
MSVAVQCEKCGKEYAVNEAALGRKVKCKKCGHVFVATRPVVDDDPNAALEAMSGLEQSGSYGQAESSSYASSSHTPPAYTPPPMAAPPPLVSHPFTAAAPTVTPWNGDAAVEREPGSIRASTANGLDTFTPLLILGFILLVLGSTGYIHSQLPDIMPDQAKSAAGKLLWIHSVIRLVLLWAVPAPAVLLGIYITSKIFRFELPVGTYLRSAGLAALGEGVLFFTGLLGPTDQAMRVLLYGGAVVGIGLLMKLSFDLRWPEAGVGALIGGLLFVVGYALSGGINAGITTAMILRSFEKEAGIDRSDLGASQRMHYDAARSSARSEIAKVMVRLPWVMLPGEIIAERQAQEKKAKEDFAKMEKESEEWFKERQRESDERLAQMRSPGTPRPPTPSPGGTSGGTATIRPGGTPAVSPSLNPADDELGRITSMFYTMGDHSAGHTGPDDVLKQMDKIAVDLAAAKKKFPANPGWAKLETDLQARRAKVAALPSKAPSRDLLQPPAITKPMPTLPVSPKLADPVYFAGLVYQPPAIASIELGRNEISQDRVQYNIGHHVKMQLVRVTRTHPTQKRVLVRTQPYQVAEMDDQALFNLDATDEKKVTEGLINGIPFVRVADNREVEFGAPIADGWVHVTIAHPFGPDTAEAIAFEASVRSIRAATATDKKNSPYAPAAVAARFPDDTKAIGAIFKQSPAEAEPFVVQFLSHENVWTRRAAAELLPEVVSAKSADALVPLLKSTDDDVVKAVKAALQKVAPDKFDEVGELLAAIKSDDTFKSRDALARLAQIPANPKRRNEVAAVLEGIVLGDRWSFEQEGAAKALAVWAGERTSLRLAPLLNNPNLFSSRRDALIMALSGCRDRAAAAVIMKWVAVAPEQVQTAMIAIGPAGEDETIRVLTQQFASKSPDAVKARAGCVSILAETGTAKSLEVLGRASRDPRDPVVQESARLAIDAVKQRLAAKAAAPATQPKP